MLEYNPMLGDSYEMQTTGPLENKVKDSNPKDAVGVRKVPMSTVSGPVMMELGLAMMEGARKYGRHNYRDIGVRSSVYYDAAMRHLVAWWEGEDTDPDSEISHLTKAIATIMVIRDAQLHNKVVDDRPPKSPKGWVNYMNTIASKIIDRYPGAKEPHVAKVEKKIKVTVKPSKKGLVRPVQK